MGIFEGSNITDDSIDLNKVHSEAQMMIEAVRDAISKLSDEEKEISFKGYIMMMNHFVQ